MNDYIVPDLEYTIVKYPHLITMKGYELRVYKNNDKFYYFNGNVHRENAPAIVYADGYKEWRFHGNRCKLGGPAIEHSNGKKEYWIDNKYFFEDTYYQELTKCYFCKYQSKDKTDLLVHYDYEEEKGNLIRVQLIVYLTS